MDNKQLSNAITECYNIINNFIQRTEDIRLRDARDIIREIERIEREYNDAVKRLPLEYFDYEKRLGEVKLGDIELQGTKFGEIELSGTVGSNNISPHKKLEEIELGGKKLTEYSLDDIAFSGAELGKIKFNGNNLCDAQLDQTILGEIKQGKNPLKDIKWKEVNLKLSNNVTTSLENLKLDTILFEGRKLEELELLRCIKGTDIRVIFGNYVKGIQLNQIICTSTQKRLSEIKFGEIKLDGSERMGLIISVNGENLEKIVENDCVLDMGWKVYSSLQSQLKAFRDLKQKISTQECKELRNYILQSEALAGALKSVKFNGCEREEVPHEVVDNKREKSRKGLDIMCKIVFILGMVTFIVSKLFLIFCTK